MPRRLPHTITMTAEQADVSGIVMHSLSIFPSFNDPPHLVLVLLETSNEHFLLACGVKASIGAMLLQLSTLHFVPVRLLLEDFEHMGMTDLKRDGAVQALDKHVVGTLRSPRPSANGPIRPGPGNDEHLALVLALEHFDLEGAILLLVEARLSHHLDVDNLRFGKERWIRLLLDLDSILFLLLLFILPTFLIGSEHFGKVLAAFSGKLSAGIVVLVGYSKDARGPRTSIMAQGIWIDNGGTQG